jgi:hypothetical protein
MSVSCSVRCCSGSRGGDSSNGSNGFKAGMFSMINISLSQALIGNRAGKVQQAIGCLVINKEVAAFEAAIVIFQELVFRLQ